VKLTIGSPTQSDAAVARIYEVEVYGRRIADPDEPDAGVGDGDTGDGDMGDGDGDSGDGDSGDGDPGDADSGDGDSGDGDSSGGDGDGDHAGGDGDGDGDQGGESASGGCTTWRGKLPRTMLAGFVGLVGLTLMSRRRRSGRH
jgi:hypothetical protein